MATAEEVFAGMAPGAPAESAAGTAISETESPEWLPALLRQHLRRVHALLYRMVGNYADAQDLAQEVFLKAYQRRRQLRDPGRLLPWLLRIASNTAIDFQRSRASEKVRIEQPEISALPTPEQQVLRDEREARLHRALQILSPKERAAIILRDLEGFTGAEVARSLGCSQITVRTHIASARIKLRRFLSKSAGGALNQREPA